MKSKNISVGLDIGTTKIVAMVGQKNEYGKVEVLGVGKSKSLGVHRGVVNNITQTIQSIQTAVTEAEAKAKAARIAMLFSRTNTMLSIPMLVAMTVAQNTFS